MPQRPNETLIAMKVQVCFDCGWSLGHFTYGIDAQPRDLDLFVLHLTGEELERLLPTTLDFGA